MWFRQLAPTVRVASGVRSYAAAAADVQAPVRVYGLAGRYAHSLFSAATKKKELDTVDSELKVVGEMLSKNQAFSDFCHNASLQRTEKAVGVKAVMAKGGFSPLTTDFMEILAENNRLSEASGIIDAFQTLMRAHRGEVQCIVTSAKELSAANKTALTKQLQRFLKSNEKLQVETKVDPSLLGGLIVEMGDKRIDMSISSRIKSLTNLLRESV